MRTFRRIAAFVGCLVLATQAAGPARAWGEDGHRVIALIAEARLTPPARERLEALLARDPEPLGPPGLATAAVWADKFKFEAPTTRTWHFVDIPIRSGDIVTACAEGRSASRSRLASQGPAGVCLVDKLYEFRRELADPNLPDAERIVALKYLIHFVGDVHQPLHAADNGDAGGNCISVSVAGAVNGLTLHSYWDTLVVRQLSGGRDPAALAAALARDIDTDGVIARAAASPDRPDWAEQWALESFRLARTVAYDVPGRATCGSRAAPIGLDAGYQARAQDVAKHQLELAGVRLARILNALLDPGAPL